MSRNNQILTGLAVSLFCFAAFWLLCSRIMGETDDSAILAAFIACLVGIFVSRERSLVLSLATLKREHFTQLSQMSARIDGLYGDSVACLVTFDDSTLTVDRASRGLLDVLGLSADFSIRGSQMDEVLGIDPTRFNTVVSQIRAGMVSAHEELECKRADGKPIKLLISGCYLPDMHAIEAAFFHLPKKTNGKRDVEQVMDDLERFRKGMVRRETRILELKSEVNRLLEGAGAAVRYQVDHSSDDSRFARIVNGM